MEFTYPQGLKKALTFSYDDGVTQDRRLIELFGRYGLKATFNLNSGLFGLQGEVPCCGTTAQNDSLHPPQSRIPTRQSHWPDNDWSAQT